MSLHEDGMELKFFLVVKHLNDLLEGLMLLGWKILEKRVELKKYVNIF